MLFHYSFISFAYECVWDGKYCSKIHTLYRKSYKLSDPYKIGYKCTMYMVSKIHIIVSTLVQTVNMLEIIDFIEAFHYLWTFHPFITKEIIFTCYARIKDYNNRIRSTKTEPKQKWFTRTFLVNNCTCAVLQWKLSGGVTLNKVIQVGGISH